jgi:transposase
MRLGCKCLSSQPRALGVSLGSLAGWRQYVSMVEYALSEDVLSEFFGSVIPILDERQKRLVTGAASKMFGHGGIRAVARMSGLDQTTVSRGATQIESGVEETTRIRAVGGGRKRLTETQPGIEDALDALVEPVTRGDPMSPLRWTTKSVQNLANELVSAGFKVSGMSVYKMLRAKGFSLQGTSKTLEGSSHPDRDDQFRYIAGLVSRFQAAGQPATSCDAKKKEKIGQYANGGREWQPKGQPVPVKDHDFPDPDLPKAVPYGVYDMTDNSGFVSVGISADTAEFAVNSIGTWWHGMGRAAYPNARELLITVDAGGSNGSRNRLWKKLITKFALEEGLEVTVCHFPPGTSKWNKIEHRMFSQITLNWRGRPLTSYETVVNLIGSTTTSQGLKVGAALDNSVYRKGVKVSDAELADLPIYPHLFHGDWNYTVGGSMNAK